MQVSQTIIIIKNLTIIDSSFSNNFWVETIKTINYLYNRLFVWNKTLVKIILENIWISKRQNFSYIQIYGCLIFANILEKKRFKSDY